MEPSSFASRSVLKNRETKKENPFPFVKLILPNPDLKRGINGNIIGSVALFQSESESETEDSSTHSKYIDSVLTRKLSYEHNFGVYEDDTDGSFTIVRSCNKYYNKNLYVDGKR